MFIVYGKKRKVRRLGWVADFCPICRRPQAFEISRVGMASHIYYISFGEGDLAGHIMRCGECATSLSSEESRYAAICEKKPADLAELAARTMPDLPERLGDRLAIEKRIVESPDSVEPEIRSGAIMESFRIANGLIEEKLSKGTDMDRPAAIGCLGSLLVVVGMIVAAAYLPNKPGDFFVGLLGVTAGIGFIYTLIQWGFAPRRFVAGKIIPLLVKALRPLQPSRDELAEALARCKQSKMKIARRLKLEGLWSAFSNPAAS